MCGHQIIMKAIIATEIAMGKQEFCFVLFLCLFLFYFVFILFYFVFCFVLFLEKCMFCLFL